jgi:hypothetical protein
MQHVKTMHPPGTIILAAGAQPRYWEFNASMERLVVPEGTRYFIERSCDVTGNFNDGMKKLYGEWAWFLGDDHQFHEHTLMKFLAHDVDVVVPISPMKIAPWAPCIMHGPTDGRVWHGDMPLYTWDELSTPGLMALPQGDFIGQAGMLVKRKVLDEIGYPWFKCGQLDPGRLQEDMTFCRELQQRGYTVWVDCDVVFDHWFIMGVTARKHEGKWVPALKSGHSTVVLPDAKGVKDLSIGDGTPRVTWRVPKEADYLESIART